MANPQDTQAIDQAMTKTPTPPSEMAKRMKSEQSELLKTNIIAIHKKRKEAIDAIKQFDIDLEYIGNPMPIDRVMTEGEWISEKNKYGLSLHFHDQVIANEKELAKNKSLVVELTENRNKVVEDNYRLSEEIHNLKKASNIVDSINKKLEKENASLLRKLKGIKKK